MSPHPPLLIPSVCFILEFSSYTSFGTRFTRPYLTLFGTGHFKQLQNNLGAPPRNNLSPNTQIHIPAKYLHPLLDLCCCNNQICLFWDWIRRNGPEWLICIQIALKWRKVARIITEDTMKAFRERESLQYKYNPKTIPCIINHLVEAHYIYQKKKCRSFV